MKSGNLIIIGTWIYPVSVRVIKTPPNYKGDSWTHIVFLDSFCIARSHSGVLHKIIYSQDSVTFLTQYFHHRTFQFLLSLFSLLNIMLSLIYREASSPGQPSLSFQYNLHLEKTVSNLFPPFCQRQDCWALFKVSLWIIMPQLHCTSIAMNSGRLEWLKWLLGCFPGHIYLMVRMCW